MNPLFRVKELGQSIWFDYIDRDLLDSGDFERMMTDGGVSGVTSNPTIFKNAITSTADYDAEFEELIKAHPGESCKEIFYTVAANDIRRAADMLHPIYERSGRRDGMVSMEVSPDLAHDTEATVEEARALFRRIGRPNVMIKVPATMEGLPAIERLTADGINVNVTLLFSVDRYREVVDAYQTGLESRQRAGLTLEGITSVASFFVSRIDTQVDERLESLAREAPSEQRGTILALCGKTAIANAKMAYQVYKQVIGSERFKNLQDAGAATQRLLWGSTGTKNPAYSDVLYVDSLIGPDTVNTVTPDTYRAYRDHGTPRPTLDSGVEEAEAVLSAAREHGIDLPRVTRELLDDGVKRFSDSFHELLGAIEKRVQEKVPSRRRA